MGKVWVRSNVPRRCFPVWGAAVVVLGLSACGGGSDRPAEGGVAFVIGASTDPYGSSHPRGFGVATGLLGGRLHSATERVPPTPPQITWLGRNRLVVGNGNWFLKSSPATLFVFRGGRLERLRAPSLRPDENTFAWSPNRKLIAAQPWLRVSCGPEARPGLLCTTSGRAVFVERSDGSDRHRVARGLLRGWTPDGRLLFCHWAELRVRRRCVPDARSVLGATANRAFQPLGRRLRAPTCRVRRSRLRRRRALRGCAGRSGEFRDVGSGHRSARRADRPPDHVEGHDFDVRLVTSRPPTGVYHQRLSRTA